MSKTHTINISNGSGELNIDNGTYSVTASVNGYDNSTITPTSLDIVDGTNSYAFSIEANGTLTVHVSEDGTSSGTSVEGATFIRCSSDGNTTYGTSQTSDSSGNLTFEHLPYTSDGSINVYYKQTSSDGSHTFDTTVITSALTSETFTKEVSNPLAPLRTFTLSDSNYDGLNIDSGTIILS